MQAFDHRGLAAKMSRDHKRTDDEEPRGVECQNAQADDDESTTMVVHHGHCREREERDQRAGRHRPVLCRDRHAEHGADREQKAHC